MPSDPFVEKSEFPFKEPECVSKLDVGCMLEQRRSILLGCERPSGMNSLCRVRCRPLVSAMLNDDGSSDAEYSLK